MLKVESEFELLQSLLVGEEWPKAVPDMLICNADSYEDKMERAEGILSLMTDMGTEGVRFLDFGCGEGHVATFAAQSAIISVGYDIKKTGDLEWGRELSDVPCLTTNFQMVERFGPYDKVLVYDVLDHADDPVSALKQLLTVCHEKTQIFIRFNPWCSRHGGHLYNEINKAFVHVVFTDEELEQLGWTLDVTINKIIRPGDVYLRWCEEANFKVGSKDIERCVVGNFFKSHRVVRNRIISALNIDKWDDSQLSQSFVDIIGTPGPPLVF